MGQVDQLRKLIREELRAVLKEELPKLLSEVKKTPMADPKKSLQEQVKSKLPGTLNTSVPKPIKFMGNIKRLCTRRYFNGRFTRGSKFNELWKNCNKSNQLFFTS